MSKKRLYKRENFKKLDYKELKPTKQEIYQSMIGKYSKLQEGIAYINPKANETHQLISGKPPKKLMIDHMKKVYPTIQ